MYAILAFALAAAFDWGLWQKAVRISSVSAAGGDPALADFAREEMRGTYAFVIPRDSTFFFPAHRIRTTILAAHPEFAAVSLRRRGFDGLLIRVEERTAVGRWCGSTYSPPPAAFPTGVATAECYFFDPSGFVYAALPDISTSVAAPQIESPTLNSFALYAPLVGNVEEPLGATIARASQLPDAFAFARQIVNLGSAPSALVIRDDEADVLLASGTRVTYVLGHEQDAYAALISTRNNLDLSSGAINYVDLRFPGKVYVKKKE